MPSKTNGVTVTIYVSGTTMTIYETGATPGTFGTNTRVVTAVSGTFGTTVVPAPATCIAGEAGPPACAAGWGRGEGKSGARPLCIGRLLDGWRPMQSHT